MKSESRLPTLGPIPPMIEEDRKDVASFEIRSGSNGGQPNQHSRWSSAHISRRTPPGAPSNVPSRTLPRIRHSASKGSAICRKRSSANSSGHLDTWYARPPRSRPSSHSSIVTIEAHSTPWLPSHPAKPAKNSSRSLESAPKSAGCRFKPALRPRHQQPWSTIRLRQIVTWHWRWLEKAKYPEIQQTGYQRIFHNRNEPGTPAQH